MTCTWGSEVAFDAHLVGAPNAAVQPGGLAGAAQPLVYDVAAMLDALEAGVQAGPGGLVEFARAMGGAISSATSAGSGHPQWLGPRVQPPPRAPAGRFRALADLVEDMAASHSVPVALGVADMSIAFANRRFRKLDGRGKPTLTRFKFLWLQDRYFKSPPGGHHGALTTGTILLEADINRLIAKHWVGDALDEAGLYGEFQSVRSQGRDLWSLDYGHGTNVLDLMGGAEPGGAGDDRPIYGVELPTAVVADTSGGRFHGPLCAGLIAISYLSRLISGGALVMNSSISFVGGPHAGKRGSTRTHPTARALNRLVQLSRQGGRRVELTLPAGNHLQDQLFSEGKEVTWVVQPDDKTGSTFEIWNSGFEDFAAGASVTLREPGGGTVTLPQLPSVGTYAGFLKHGDEIARLYRVSVPGHIEDHLVFAVFPTQSFDPDQPLSPSGNWRFEIATQARRKCLFWSARDDTLDGLPKAGRQAWFRDDTYLRFAPDGAWQKEAQGGSDVTRAGSRSVLAAGQMATGGAPELTVVIGDEGSRASGTSVYRFAGMEMDEVSQTTTPIGRPGKLPMAESTRALGGPMATSRTGRGTIRWSGTSMASASAARLLADQISGVATYEDRKSGCAYPDF